MRNNLRRQIPAVAAIIATLICFDSEVRGFEDHPLIADSTKPCSKWVTLADTLLIPLHSAAVGVLNGKIYLAGGIFSDQFGADTVTEVYDPIAHASTLLARLPTPRQYVCGAAVNNLFYCIGGATSNGPFFGTPSDIVEAYDPQTNSWSRKANMPTARAGACAVVLNGFIFVMGGGDSVTALNTVERYNPVNDKWTRFAPMLSAREFASAVVACDHIDVFGGDPLHPLSCEEFTTGPDTWATFSDLPIPLSHAQAVSADQSIAKVYLMGGLPGYAPVTLSYDYRALVFRRLPSMPLGRANHEAAFLNNYVYLLGGEIGPGRTTSQIDRFNVSYIASHCLSTICPGDTLHLVAAGPGAHNFQWSLDGTLIPSATDSTLISRRPGVYSVTMTLADGCSDTTSIVILSLAPAASISAVGPPAFCDGDSVILSASPTGLTYNWYKDTVALGLNTSQITVRTSGRYSVLITGPSGCSAADSITVLAKPLLTLHLAGPKHTTREDQLDTVALFVDPIASLPGSYPLQFSIKYDSSTLGFVAFLTACQPVTAIDDPLHGIVKIRIDSCPVSAGNPVGRLVFQTVVGTTLTPHIQIEHLDSTNACLSIEGLDTLISLTPFGCQLSTLNVTPFASSIISINPNPAQGFVQIQYGLVEEVPVLITIDDILGRPVRTIIDQAQRPGSYAIIVSTSGLADGIYFVRYLTRDSKDTRELHLGK